MVLHYITVSPVTLTLASSALILEKSNPERDAPLTSSGPVAELATVSGEKLQTGYGWFHKPRAYPQHSSRAQLCYSKSVPLTLKM